MARIAFLIKQPKRALGALAVLVAATGVVIGSGASFSASSANPENEFSAGTLTIENSKPGVAIFSAQGLKPGDTPVTGTVHIRNTGSLAGDFKLERTALTNTDLANPLAARLNLVITDCGQWPDATTAEPCDDGDDTNVWTGTLAAYSGQDDVGNFGPDEKHTFKFSVQLDSSAGDAYQGDGAEAEFTWTAAQS